MDRVEEIEAAIQGLPPEDYKRLAQWFRAHEVDEPESTQSLARLQKTNPEEWVRRFNDWVDSHDPNTPVLSDEAMSRDSIYPDRI
jgi:hypothetical protein